MNTYPSLRWIALLVLATIPAASPATAAPIVGLELFSNGILTSGPNAGSPIVLHEFIIAFSPGFDDLTRTATASSEIAA